MGLLGEGLGPGEFFCLLGFAGGRFVCDAEGALAGGLACPELVERACRAFEFGAEPADQATFFFLGPFETAQDRSLGIQGNQPAKGFFVRQRLP